MELRREKLIHYLILTVCLVCLLCGGYSVHSQAAASVRPKLSRTELSLTKRHEFRLRLSGASGKVVWNSSNRKVATVTSTGVVQGKSAGKCVITARYKGKKYRCYVSVYNSGTEWKPARLNKKYRPSKNQEKIVLAGSSSIEYWSSAAAAFRPYSVVNVGIAGTKASDWLKLYRRLIVQYKPKAVVLYVGGNDIAADRRGNSGLRTAAVQRKLLTQLQRELPDVPIYCVSISPNPRRWSDWKQIQIYNREIKKFCKGRENLNFIDCTSYLLKNGKYQKKLYRSDGMHFNNKGYAIWNKVIAGRLKKDLG